MEKHQAVVEHYLKNDLAVAIFEGLEEAGKDLKNLKQEDLAAVDEFHIRGREATLELAAQLDLDASKKVLDVGSGIGGASRYLASGYGCEVTGLDLNQAYCEVAELLANKIGLDHLIRYQQGNALAMPFEDESFDIAWTQHAAMNIADKEALYAEIWRVLKPDGLLAMFDIVEGSGGSVLFPVPWAREPSISFLSTPATLKASLKHVGFELISWRDTSDEGKRWFKDVKEKMQGLKGAPPLGFHLLMGADFKEMAVNQVRNLNEDRIRLIEAIVRRPV